MPDLQWKKLKEIVDQSDNIVGAGLSRLLGLVNLSNT